MTTPIACAHRTVLALLAACIALMAPGAVGQPQLRPYVAGNVDLRSDADRDTVHAIARHYHRMLDGYRRVLNIPPGGDDDRPLVYLLSTREVYEAHLQSRGIDGGYSGGIHYWSREHNERAVALPLDSDLRSRVLAVAQHEGFHQFAAARFEHPIPMWLNEGLAEYFEDGLVHRGSFKVGFVPAHRLDHLREAHRQGKWLTLQELLTIDNEAWHEAMRRGSGRTLYEQAWSLVHFLRHSNGPGGGTRRFDLMMQELARGKTYEEAMRRAYGSRGLPSLEPLWERVTLEQLEPDGLSTTRNRILFAAMGLKSIHENAPDRMPSSYEALGEMLKQANFQVRHTSHGITTVQRARDPRYFPAADARPSPRQQRLQLTRPAGRDLPPGVEAVATRPRITLSWSRDNQGRLIDHLSFE